MHRTPTAEKDARRKREADGKKADDRAVGRAGQSALRPRDAGYQEEPIHRRSPGLQTLINTYPDSEYLAKAKLGVADSYYQGRRHVEHHQAIQEYKDFITFFPFLDEAAYAQMQVAWRITG